jgi:hypothetical protein
MKADGAWDHDPTRDPLLQRALGDSARAPLGEADARRLEAAIMTAVRREVVRGITATWWEVAARWAPAAAAAGIAAVLLSGAVFLSMTASGSASPGEEAAPETAAVAQVIDQYPEDAVLASLISGDEPDALSPWGEP